MIYNKPPLNFSVEYFWLKTIMSEGTNECILYYITCKVLPREKKAGQWSSLFEKVITAMNYYQIPSNVFAHCEVGHGLRLGRFGHKSLHYKWVEAKRGQVHSVWHRTKQTQHWSGADVRQQLHSRVTPICTK